VVGNRPEDHIRRAIRRVLADVLGPPKASVWGTLTLQYETPSNRREFCE
jgi:hypothetical protein